MSCSQFYVLSPRGDSIVFRDFRGDLEGSTAEVFFRNVKFWEGKQQDAPPMFHLDGVSYVYIRKSGLFFVFAATQNLAPLMVVELLLRLTKVFKDYCGVLSEESLRTNFILVYELLDEVMDFGYAQGTSSDHLKSYVYNEPIMLKKPKKKLPFKLGKLGKLGKISKRTTPSNAVDKPITARTGDGKHKNEIFVDIYERISVTFNASGYVLNSGIDGTIQMKSYLAGNPELRLALNEDLAIGRDSAPQGRVGVVVDDCNFHECVRFDDFEQFRVLRFKPPDGEFTMMNYRITSEFRCPFRIFPFFELVSPYKVELIVKIRADIPPMSYGGNVVVTIPMPKSTSGVSSRLAVHNGQGTDYDAKKNVIQWRIKKFKGGSEHVLRSKINLRDAATSSVRKEIGPISMQFEIPMYNPSSLQVRYLRIIENKQYNPYRWVRYVTKSSSYVCRL